MIPERPEPTDITEHIRGICDALGLVYHDVAELRIEPSKVDALWYLPNENGKKHIDTKSGNAVMTRRTFPVRS